MNLENDTPLPDLSVMPHFTLLQKAKLPANSNNLYSLPNRWAIHLYLNEATLTIGKYLAKVRPGILSLTPPGWVSLYQTSCELNYYCIHFDAECLNESFPIAKNGSDLFSPLFSDLQGEEPYFSNLFEQALGRWPLATLLCSVKMWEILLEWQFRMIPYGYKSNPPLGNNNIPFKSEGTHPALNKALAYIERNLSEVKSVSEVAQKSGCSAVHLARLFKTYLGVSVATWTRSRRLEIAKYQLLSTTKPIKIIAWEAGYPDLHAFNKLCKSAWGISPRGLRNR